VEGHPDPAAWARAAAVWERHNHPYPAAYARLREAEALFAERTRNAAAVTALRSAYRTAQRLGAHPFIDEVRGLAERARATLYDDVPEVPVEPLAAPDRKDELAVLTDRERQILARVANGETNREIGEHLYISPRTVGVHISHILDKLQVRSRVQATAIYQRNRHDLSGPRQ
jgi:DNA-binding NarL/FixJ family response regulator